MKSHDEIVIIGSRSWRFLGAEIDLSSEFECRTDGSVLLLGSKGNVIEGVELSDSEAEQLDREVMLADVLELAAAKLRSGEGWDEGTTGDVFSEILHCYPSNVKKALRLALLSGPV